MNGTPTWSRHPGQSPALCIQCGERPPVKPRQICNVCRAKNEKQARIDRMAEASKLPCVIEGCDQPRVVTATQVRSRCREHQREYSREHQAEQRRAAGVPERPERKQRPADIPDHQWWCYRCDQIKHVSEFGISKSHERGLNPRCKECETEIYQKRLLADPESVRRPARESQRRNRRRRAYGLTQEEFDDQVIKQDGRCVSCGRQRALVVEHDHQHEAPTTKEAVRGFTCGQCNSALGLLDDDPVRVMLLLAYIQNPPYPFRESEG